MEIHFDYSLQMVIGDTFFSKSLPNVWFYNYQQKITVLIKIKWPSHSIYCMWERKHFRVCYYKKKRKKKKDGMGWLVTVTTLFYFPFKARP